MAIKGAKQLDAGEPVLPSATATFDELILHKLVALKSGLAWVFHGLNVPRSML